MSEQPTTPSENHPQSKRPEFYTRLPNGKLVNVFDLIDQQKRDLEPEMGTSSLRAGDIIAFQYANEQGESEEMVFDIKESEWRDLGMGTSSSPHPTLIGRLDGPNLPEEIKNQDATFIGSGFGGSVRMPAVLATGRSPYFLFPKGEYRFPFIDYFEIFRKGQQGNFRPLDPNQLDAEIRGKIAKHDERIAKAEQLMEKFGFKFNFRDCSKTSTEDHFEYEDEKYIAVFRGEMALGNKLVVYDKQTGQWMELKYYNFKNDDFLQVAFANISRDNLKNDFYSISDESGVHRSGVGITTFITSGRFGIEVINYKTSEKEVRENLGDLSRGDYTYSPDIQIWPDGRIEIPKSFSIFMMQEKEPNIAKRIKNSVKVRISPESTMLDLNGKNLQLKNPDVEIDKVLTHMNGGPI